MKFAFAMLVAVAWMTIPVPAGAQSAKGFGHYGSLFDQPKPLTPAPRGQAPENQKPSVVCGMTLLPANPKIDPAIRIPPPSNRRFPMLTLEPTVCRSSAATGKSSTQTKQK